MYSTPYIPDNILFMHSVDNGYLIRYNNKTFVAVTEEEVAIILNKHFFKKEKGENNE
jgi:hypothetical protein